MNDHTDETDDDIDFTETDAELLPLIAANPAASPDELAGLFLDKFGGGAPALVLFGARRTVRNRAAELLGVEPPPACINAEEDRMNAEIQAVIVRSIADLEREASASA